MNAASGALLRRRVAIPSIPPHWRRRLAIVVVGLTALGALYLLWLRDNPLVQVKDVTVTGLTSDDAPDIRAALEAEASEMTTLHVRRGELEQVVQGYPVVRDLEVRSDFPNGLRIHVLEHHPAAVVASGRSRLPVAADGSVLSGLPVKSGSLPLVKVSGALPADHVDHTGTLDLLRVSGAAPGALVPRLEETKRDGARGIVVTIEDGPELVFGAPTRVRGKWRAATRVLADQASQGATYVDVRLPDRPVAGGLPVETFEPADPAFTYSQP